jgi:hypothetical protein
MPKQKQIFPCPESRPPRKALMKQKIQRRKSHAVAPLVDPKLMTEHVKLLRICFMRANCYTVLSTKLKSS